MLLIPIGLIFVLFYFNVSVFGLTVDLLLDAVGYILIAVNASRLRDRSWSFGFVVPLCAVLAVYSTVVRLWQPTGLLSAALSLAEVAAQIWLLRLLVTGVEELERDIGKHLNSTVLARWQKWLSISLGASYACAVLLMFYPFLSLVGMAVAVVWAVLSILFIVVFFRTHHRYSLILANGTDGGTEDDAADS